MVQFLQKIRPFFLSDSFKKKIEEQYWIGIKKESEIQALKMPSDRFRDR